MAEHTQSDAAELGAPMDYREHDRTYHQFLGLAKLTAVGTFNVMVSLILFGFGSPGTGFWLGMLMLLMTLLAAAVGLVGRGSVRPSAIVFVIGLLFVVLAVA